MRAAADETSTIEPPVRIIARAPARTAANADVRFAAMVAAHSSSEVGWAGFNSSEPTQLTMPSRRP